jgi:hypothetical protein
MKDDLKPDANRPAHQPYEPPRVEDLGTFAELTQARTDLRQTDNPGQRGTR